MSQGMRALKPRLIPRRFQVWCLTTPKIPLCYFARSLTAFVPFPLPLWWANLPESSWEQTPASTEMPLTARIMHAAARGFH